MNNFTSSPSSPQPKLSNAACNSQRPSTSSIYDENSTENSLPSTNVHEYGVYYGKWRANLVFCDTDSAKSPVYLAEISEFTSNKPDVTIHDVKLRGKEDTSGPVLAVSRFRWSRNIKLGLGDPANDPNSVVWEEMKNQAMIGHSKYRFEFTSTSMGASFSAPFANEIPPSSRPETRRAYIWQRTNSTKDGVSAWGKLTLGNYKFIDETSGETVAVFLSNGARSWKKSGKLRIRDDVEKDLEIIIVLCAASLAEKLRRREKWGSAGGGYG